ncbi:hypothetical protein SDC9_180158 [bioreactor metagenome]|uniref:Uncharacterized protein n=1 Tax=bioreactor metagenome TaxID=1076179 RepID=A0A645H117_9ZZZZ
MAGLKCPPDTCPTAYAMVSTVRPNASDTPIKPMPTSGKPAASTALPHPPSTNQKVPKNSANSLAIMRSLQTSYETDENGDLPVTPCSERCQHVQEPAPTVVRQVGQIIGIVGKVVASAHLHVLADMPVHRDQRASTSILCLGCTEIAPFQQSIPLPHEVPVGTQHQQISATPEPFTVRIGELQVTDAQTVLRTQ